MNTEWTVYYGWIDTGVPSLLDGLIGALPGLPRCWITRIDSYHEVKDLPSVKSRLPGAVLPCQRCGDGILVSMETAIHMARGLDWFSGFEELWFLETEPARELPPDLWIVPPVAVDAAVLDRFNQWMHESGVFLGMAGGLGVNWVTTSADLADVIIRWSAANDLEYLQNDFGHL